MSTGIKCDKSCYEAYEDLKLLKKYRYILFHIYNNQEIKVLHRAAREANYDDFMQDLITAMNAGEGRYAVYDYELKEKVNSIVFILWVPSSLDVKVRMIYAASKSALKAKLVGVKYEVEANDLEEITEEELFKKVR
ncbi:Cofilin [Schistosoma japonicum]|uniref:Putative Cofilin-1 n=1 Tax=Schistosoma japonicum TaxID=6182 RepID=C1L849_SCHJA|nr:Cofilin [Schistosoma japonicum]CAX70876.1 putative Cofilin-1 [Schistosoma japonicum]CAX70877.1 putative Cofilin-1 [Schistosoma japonicum]